jgi:dUTP pyrophosphatase
MGRNCNSETCIIKIKKINKNAKIPKKAHINDAAMDLYSVVNLTIPSGGRAIIDTGLQVETIKEWKISIKSRSGLASKGISVANSPGLVDSCTYRGNIGVILENRTSEPFIVNIGDRIAQMEAERCWATEIVEVTELSETDRGEGGFGHTGIK